MNEKEENLSEYINKKIAQIIKEDVEDEVEDLPSEKFIDDFENLLFEFYLLMSAEQASFFEKNFCIHLDGSNGFRIDVPVFNFNGILLVLTLAYRTNKKYIYTETPNGYGVDYCVTSKSYFDYLQKYIDQIENLQQDQQNQLSI